MNKHQFFLGDLEIQIIHNALLYKRDFYLDFDTKDDSMAEFCREELIKQCEDLAKKFEIKE